jgi:hypothetical protein
MARVSLCGEILPEEKFSVFGFVPIDVIALTKGVWFRKLNTQQIVAAGQFLSENGRNHW